MTKTSGLAAKALAVVVLSAMMPAATLAGHFTLAFQRQIPAWENGSGTGCMGNHFCRVWVWDENGNPLAGIHLETERSVDIGHPQTDATGWAEIIVNKGADFDLFCTDGTASTSDTTRLMTSNRPECWGHYSFEVGFLYKTSASNPGEFDLDLHGTWNEPTPALQDDDAPYTKSLAYNGVNPANYWSDQTDLGNWQTASSYFGQTFVATGNRVVAARVPGALAARAPVDCEARIVNFPDVSSPVGPYKSVARVSNGGSEIFWAVNDNPVEPGQTYMLQVRRGGDGMNIWRVNANVYPSGRYYEGTTPYSGLDLNGHVVAMTCDSAPPTGNVLVLLELDESSGTTAADTSGNGRHGTLYGDPLWRPVGGRTGGALQLDGTDDSISIIGFQGIMGTSSRTVAAWIKTDSTDYGDIVAWGMEASGRRWSLVVGSVGGSFGVYVGDGFAFGTNNVCDGEWHHIAAALHNDGSPNVDEVRLYADGRAETVAASQSREITTARYFYVTVGTFDDGEGRYFLGLVDEIAIFDFALSEEQISRLCHVGAKSFLEPCGGFGVEEEYLLDADISGNCEVDGVDLALLARLWLETGPLLPADIHQDESVDWLDVSLLAETWTDTIPPPAE